MRAGLITLLVLGLFVSFGLAGPGSTAGAQEEPPQETLEAEFEKAANEYDVPKELLKAIGYVNTRWEMPPPDASAYEPGGPEEGSPESRGNYGIMALYDNPSQDTLGKAAELTGLSKEELKKDRSANIRGGAALLAEAQGEKPEEINGWYDAVAETWDGPLYANQVYETLKSGASAEVAGEKVELPAQPQAEPRDLFSGQASADYGRATWYGTNGNNYSSANRGRQQINKVIVHVTQGSFSGAINWFRDPRANVSAHYTIRSKDGFIGQSVRDKDIAWHAGNWDYNRTSIGIEHEGYVDNSSWFTDKMYRSSARLTASLVKKYRIPVDRKHIIGHNQVPGATHTDPGRYWNWSKYLRYVRNYAGSNTKYTQIIDNSSSRFTASPNWKFSSWSSQKYGKNYRYTSPKRVKDLAKYRLKFPNKARYAVAARWPANSGYNGRVKFKIRTASGWKTKIRSQRRNGGKWVWLGTFTMSGGDYRAVKISRSSKSDGYIIADAVRIRKK